MTIKTARLARLSLLCAALFAGSSAYAADSVRIVALGDSLSAGYGLDPGDSFPEQLESALRARGIDVAVTNAGVSGDTASDGLARLEWSVPADAQIVIVELGANDMLRGLDPAITRNALSTILAKLRDRNQAALLAGMHAARNMDERYVAAFDAIYPDLAREYGVPLYPFFLQGVTGDPSLNLEDGLHPTAAGIAKIVRSILPMVEALVLKVRSSG